MTIPSTMTELRAEVRRVACTSMTSVIDNKHGIRVRRKGDQDQAGLVFLVKDGIAYSRKPWTRVWVCVAAPEEIGVLARQVADGAFSPRPCFDCEEPTFKIDDAGDPCCGCLKGLTP